jgi:hypothetical protein
MKIIHSNFHWQTKSIPRKLNTLDINIPRIGDKCNNSCLYGNDIGRTGNPPLSEAVGLTTLIPGSHD